MKENTQRVYVEVTSDFDPTGYMHPRKITWSDGREFQIEEVRNFRPATQNTDRAVTDCYTVVVRGEIKYLFFEKAGRYQSSRIGRWYVECPKNSR